MKSATSSSLVEAAAFFMNMGVRVKPKEGRMIVLGYNGFDKASSLFANRFNRTGIDRNRVLGHDASAALFVDGVLVSAVEEERFTREKKTSRFPYNAIAYCLAEAKLDIKDVDFFSFPWCFDEQVLQSFKDKILTGSGEQQKKEAELNNFLVLYNELASTQNVRKELEEVYPDVPDIGGKLVCVPHHVAHLMAGYYQAGVDHAAFLISDGRAETYSSIGGEISHDKLTFFPDTAVDISNSLGMMYSKITRYLGFMPNNDEYKVMALASFCREDIPEAYVEKLVTFHDEGRYSLSFSNKLRDDLSYYAYLDDVFEGKNHFFIAATAQKAVELASARRVDDLYKRAKARHLIVDGGVALNCVNNSKLLSQSSFEEISVGFASNDCGTTIGAAYYVAYQKAQPALRLPLDRTPYLGPDFGDDEILEALDACGSKIKFEVFNEESLVETVAQKLHEGAVVGWFNGRMEFGPRALGNRSILASPSYPGMKDILNTKVKNRETFRPFAAVVSEEKAAEYFVMGKKKRSPYMTFVFPVQEEYREKLNEAINIDGTSRIQTVSQQQNAKLYALLKAFEKRTGVSCLINTSFNVQGEPIVLTPMDALACFLNTHFDFLVLGNYLIRK